MIRAVRFWVLIVVFLAALHTISASSLHAQTPTPTAGFTPTPVASPTPVGSPSPTPIPDVTGSKTIWYCNGDADMVHFCTWGDYWDFDTVLALNGAGGSQSVDVHQRYRFLPPSDTKRLQVTCSFYGYVIGYRHTTALPATTWEVDYKDLSQTKMYFVAPTGGGRTEITSLLLDLDWPTASRWQTTSAFMGETRKIEWELITPTYSAWPNPVGFYPDTGDTGWEADYVGIDFDMQIAMVSAPPETYIWQRQAAACEVSEVERLDGSIYVPDDPYDIGDPTPEPTPTTCYIGCDEEIIWNPIGWEPMQPITQEVEFGLSPPEEASCYDIPPEIGPYTVTIPGWFERVAYVPGVELCISEQEFQMEIFDLDLDLLVYSLFGVAVLAFFVRTVFS